MVEQGKRGTLEEVPCRFARKRRAQAGWIASSFRRPASLASSESLRKVLLMKSSILTLICLLCVPATAWADVINVPGDQPTIQAGIDAAADGDEVVLADGVYTGPGNVNCSFNGKLITVRSASDNPEACIIDCETAEETRGFTFDNGETNEAVLRGVTITNGNVTANGGAISILSASPSIINCRFIANQVITNIPSSGGGAINNTGGFPAVRQCDFINNIGGAAGGAVVGQGEFESCRFVGNQANGSSVGLGGDGGAVRMAGGTTVKSTFVNCLFNGNYAHKHGGALWFPANDVDIISCTFVSNVSNGQGSTSQGGAIWTSGDASIVLNVTNSILFGNGTDEIFNGGLVTINVQFSNVDGGWPGLGNINDGPLFFNAPVPDLMPGTIDDDFSLRSFSPCADSGDNTAVPPGLLFDLTGNPRFADDPNSPDTGVGKAPIVDMGCFEFQPPAAPPQSCVGDLAPEGGDGVVGVADLLMLLSKWGACP